MSAKNRETSKVSRLFLSVRHEQHNFQISSSSPAASSELPFKEERPFIRWLARSGKNVAYVQITDNLM